MVGVVELYVRDDGALGVMHHQRAVGFIHLRHQPSRAAGPGVAAIANQHCRVQTGLRQDVPRHVGHRRLAVAAPDGYRVCFRYEPGEGLGTCLDLDSHRTGGHKLWSIFSDRAAEDEQVLAEHVLGIVPDLDGDACVLELGRGLRRLRVATAHLVAASEIDAREGAYARATDPHQVNSHFRLPTSRRTPSTRWAASRRPAAAEARAMASSWVG